MFRNGVASIRLLNLESLDYLRQRPRNIGISRHIKWKTEIGEFLLNLVNMEIPSFPKDKEIILSPKTDAYTITGHAFELLIRFHINFVNGTQYDAKVCRNSIISESRLRTADEDSKLYKLKRPDLVKICKEKNISTSGKKDELRHRILNCVGVVDCECFRCLNLSMFDQRVSSMNKGIDASNSREKTIIALQFALLEYARLSKYPFRDDWYARDFSQELIEDVENLFKGWLEESSKNIEKYSFVEFNLFKLLGEPDFFIENMTLDMKAVKRIKKREHLAQQIGYAFLSMINGMDVDSIGLYYARHKKMISIPLDKAVLGDTQLAFNRFRGMVVQSVANHHSTALTRDEEDYCCETGLVKFEIIEI